jgi:hypothetical protein
LAGRRQRHRRRRQLDDGTALDSAWDTFQTGRSTTFPSDATVSDAIGERGRRQRAVVEAGHGTDPVAVVGEDGEADPVLDARRGTQVGGKSLDD